VNLPANYCLTCCCLDSPFLFIPKLYILLDRPELSASSLTQSLLSNSFNFQCHIQCLTQLVSSLHSTCPNHLNLLFLIIKLTGANPKSSLNSSFLFTSACNACRTWYCCGKCVCPSVIFWYFIKTNAYIVKLFLPSQKVGAQASQKFWDYLPTPIEFGLEWSNSVTCGEQCVSRGQPRPNPKGQGTNVQIFGTSDMHAHSIKYSKKIAWWSN